MSSDWVDVHCHILPGIDDGASSFEEALKMAEIAAADGIREIIATPHVTDNSRPPEELNRHVDALNELLVSEGIPVGIYTGAEVAVSLEPTLFRRFTLNQGNFVLIELPHNYLPSLTPNLLSYVASDGLVPIIAHPERNLGIIRNPDAFIQILSPHVCVQITAGSLTGDFGVDAKLCAELLLDAGRVDIIASDAHSAGDRPPVLSGAFDIAAKQVGEKTALRMVRENPAAVLRGGKISRE